MSDEFPGWHGTTIIGVKKDGKVVIVALDATWKYAKEMPVFV